LGVDKIAMPKPFITYGIESTPVYFLKPGLLTLTI
jgi:hypothetical protein